MPRLFGILASLALVTSPLSAQYTPSQGLSFGFGAGYASYDCQREDCSNRQGAVAGYVTLGYRINPNLSVELGGNLGWIPLHDSLLLTYLGVVWSPEANNRIRFKVGAGSGVDFDNNDFSAGVGFIVGLGYAVPVSRTVAFVPFVHRTSMGGTNVIQVGLGLGIN